MRTTLTLDDDLADMLQDLALKRRVPFRRVVNEMIRKGLQRGRSAGRGPEPFAMDTFKSPFRAGIDPLRLNQLVDELETVRAAPKVRR